MGQYNKIVSLPVCPETIYGVYISFQVLYTNTRLSRKLKKGHIELSAIDQPFT